MIDKYSFPEPPREMTWDEMYGYFHNMLEQIRQYNPDEIIAVNRSGYAYGMWVSQQLKLPLGSYWPDMGILIKHPSSKRIVFVDDNIVQGSTFLHTCEFMKNNEFEWRWAVLFTDWFTPEDIEYQVIKGVKLPYFAEGGIPGLMKVIQGYGVRSRDE